MTKGVSCREVQSVNFLKWRMGRSVLCPRCVIPYKKCYFSIGNTDLEQYYIIYFLWFNIFRVFEDNKMHTQTN